MLTLGGGETQLDNAAAAKSDVILFFIESL